MNRDNDLPVGDVVAAASPSVHPAAIVHRGTHVELRPINARTDAEALYAGSHGDHRETLWTYMPYGPFGSVRSMADWLREIAAGDDPRFFTVCALPAGQPLGIVSYLSIVAEHRCLEIGHIWYITSAQRTAVNTDSIYLLLRHAFDDLGYRRVEWKCDALNARSRAAAERLGFHAEGVFRQHRIVRGRNRDTAWLAMTDQQWPMVRANMVSWLAATPAQRPSLRALSAVDSSVSSP